MEFSSLRFADVIVVAPVGRIDHATAEALQLKLEPLLVAAAGMGGALVLDLAKVEYVSSVGLRVVMMAAKHLKARKARIAAVAAAGMGGALVLDLAKVEYVSSVGLRVVMMAAKHLKARKARIAAVALQPIVREIFEIARFNHVVELFPSLADALQELSAPARAAYDAGTGSVVP